jgi:succinylglutamic semialdehyde dehydrogenase
MICSVNPATQEIVWQGVEASQAEIEAAITAAKSCQKKWQSLPFEERASICRRFASLLNDDLALSISQEMGKPLWESKNEVESMRKKVEISIQAIQERCPQSATLRYKPHGIAAVFGPFNFPGHLPNGHIVPLLLAGNAVLFKPSELTPATANKIAALWKQAGLMDGLLQVIQGGALVGKFLVHHPDIRGIYFTGSSSVGQLILKESLSIPNRIVALEMGGNNPLIVRPGKNLELQVLQTIQSAFTTSGQRCSCARRLILIRNEKSSAFLELLQKKMKQLIIAPFTMLPEPFMGPLVTIKAALHCMAQYEALVHKGAKVLVPLKQLQKESSFLTTALIDSSDITPPDEEIFGPVLQLFSVANLDEAIVKANQTAYGLTAALLSDDPTEFEQVFQSVQAGIINYNAPTIGASGHAPFGGIGKSGNFRPSGYFAADYASYPVASSSNINSEPPPGYVH